MLLSLQTQLVPFFQTSCRPRTAGQTKTTLVAQTAEPIERNRSRHASLHIISISCLLVETISVPMRGIAHTKHTICYLTKRFLCVVSSCPQSDRAFPIFLHCWILVPPSITQSVWVYVCVCVCILLLLLLLLPTLHSSASSSLSSAFCPEPGSNASVALDPPAIINPAGWSPS